MWLGNEGDAATDLDRIRRYAHAIEQETTSNLAGKPLNSLARAATGTYRVTSTTGETDGDPWTERDHKIGSAGWPMGLHLPQSGLCGARKQGLRPTRWLWDAGGSRPEAAEESSLGQVR